TADGGEFEVWDGEDWTRCLARTAYRHAGDSIVLHGRGGILQCTPDHVVFAPEGEQPAAAFCAGDRVVLAAQPTEQCQTVLTPEEAWFLGLLAAAGHVSKEGRGRITCGDLAALTLAES